MILTARDTFLGAARVGHRLDEEHGGDLVDAVVGEGVDLPPAVHRPAGGVLVSQRRPLAVRRHPL